MSNLETSIYVKFLQLANALDIIVILDVLNLETSTLVKEIQFKNKELIEVAELNSKKFPKLMLVNEVQ